MLFECTPHWPSPSNTELSITLCYLMMTELGQGAWQFNLQHRWVPFYLLNNFNFHAYCKLLSFQCNGHSLFPNHFCKTAVLAVITERMHCKTVLTVAWREYTITTSYQHKGWMENGQRELRCVACCVRWCRKTQGWPQATKFPSC
jgi:hypothetical protein